MSLSAEQEDLLLEMLSGTLDQVRMANRVSELLIELGFEQTSVVDASNAPQDYIKDNVAISLGDMLTIHEPVKRPNCFRLDPPFATKHKETGSWATTEDADEFIGVMRDHITDLLKASE